jgi:hypothetical protein
LTIEEDALAGAAAHREAGQVALVALIDGPLDVGNRAAADSLGEAIHALGERAPYEEFSARLNEFCVRARIAFCAIRQTNAELVQAITNVSDSAACELLAQTEQGFEDAKSNLNFTEAAYFRVLAAGSNIVEEPDNAA